MSKYWVYIIANDRPTLYIGVTSNLPQRISIHKQELASGFTQKYHLHKLVYFEEYNSIHEAIVREKRLKKWKRDWKLQMIRIANPNLEDLGTSLNI